MKIMKTESSFLEQSRQNQYAVPAIALIFFQFISIGRPQDVIYAIRAIHPGVVAISLSIISILIYWPKLSGIRLSESVTIRRFRNLVILMFLIIPLSVIPAKSSYYMLNDFSRTIIYFFCFCKFVTSLKFIRISMTVMILSSLMLSLAMIAKGSGGQRVSVGTNYDPNDMALLLVSILPIAVSFSQFEKGTVRIVAIMTAIFSLVALGMTQSRGGYLGLFVIFLLWIFQKNHYTKIKKYGKILFLGFIFLFVAIQFIPTEVIDRFQSITDEDTTGSGRLTVWPRIIRMMFWHPQGVGAGNFTSAYGRHLSAGDFKSTTDDARERAWMTAHNSFLLVGAELGFTGIILYLIWIAGMMRNLKLLKKKIQKYELEDRVFQYCSTVELGLIGFIIPAFFLSQSFSHILLTFAAYVAALDRIVATSIKEKATIKF